MSIDFHSKVLQNINSYWYASLSCLESFKFIDWLSMDFHSKESKTTITANILQVKVDRKPISEFKWLKCCQIMVDQEKPMQM